MLFYEYAFLFAFLPLSLGVYYVLPRARKNLWLFLSGCAFYSASSFEYLPLLLGSIAIDFIAGRRIGEAEDPRVRRVWLICSLSANLGALAFFKYAGFITSNLSLVLGPSVPIVAVALPVGISFYTFQSMSYTIDVYRRAVAPITSFADFGAYVTMFPQLIAGPIVRFSHVREQLGHRDHSVEKFGQGLHLFVLGLAKKLIIADTLAEVAEPIFGSSAPGFAGAWGSMILYAGQIYFDFSGYSDMAIGLGRMMGFEFPVNFDSPYQATSFSDFWRRWHITLSTWLRDYLYVPLGGNRRGSARTYLNLSLTMLLGGLWHGASWNFVLWGAAHGSLLAIERALRTAPLPSPPKAVRITLVFLLVVMVWVPFKFDGFDEARLWIGAMLGSGGLGSLRLSEALAVVAALLLFFVPRNTSRWTVRLGPKQAIFTILVFTSALFVGYGRVSWSPFLYFRF